MDPGRIIFSPVGAAKRRFNPILALCCLGSNIKDDRTPFTMPEVDKLRAIAADNDLAGEGMQGEANDELAVFVDPMSGHDQRIKPDWYRGR